MSNAAMDARARRLLVSQAPLDQVPATAFLPALTAVLGPGLVLSQRVSPDASSAAAEQASRAMAAAPGSLTGGRWCWPAADQEAWRARLEALTSALAPTPALYFSVRWGTLGALRAAPSMVLPHAVALAAQSLGCLLTSLTGEDGLRLDLLEGDAAAPGRGTFELIVWGAQWGRTALETLEHTPTP